MDTLSHLIVIENLVVNKQNVLMIVTREIFHFQCFGVSMFILGVIPSFECNFVQNNVLLIELMNGESKQMIN